MAIVNQPECKDNLIPTLNQMGYMLSKPEAFNQAFIDFASQADGSLLDIGAAYGIATLAALEKGAYVIANDLDARHLAILKSKVSPKYLHRLELKLGRVPDEIDFPKNNLAGVLASRALNFLKPEQLEESIRKIFNWLKPGGRLFILGATPAMQTFKSFYPTYIKRKSEGHQWPGFIADLHNWVIKEEALNLPKHIILFDEELLTNLLENAGFIINEVGYSSVATSNPENPDEKLIDTIGVIAIKPQ
jgi:SAM-dependent methyltransferase